MFSFFTRSTRWPSTHWETQCSPFSSKCTSISEKEVNSRQPFQDWLMSVHSLLQTMRSSWRAQRLSSSVSQTSAASFDDSCHLPSARLQRWMQHRQRHRRHQQRELQGKKVIREELCTTYFDFPLKQGYAVQTAAKYACVCTHTRTWKHTLNHAHTCTCG